MWNLIPLSILVICWVALGYKLQQLDFKLCGLTQAHKTNLRGQNGPGMQFWGIVVSILAPFLGPVLLLDIIGYYMFHIDESCKLPRC